MSIDMYLGPSKAQGSSASALSQSYQAGFQALQAAVGQFTQDTLLRSQAYDSGKSYFQGVYIPLIQGAILVAEATEKAVEKLPNDYVSQVDSCDLKSSELEAEIQRYETQIQGMQNQMDQIKQLLPVSSERVQHLREASGLISDYTSAKRKLEKQLQKLLAFHAFSSTLFTEVTSLQNAVNQGLAQVSGGKGFDPKTGTFSPKNLKDTRWMITIGNAWDKRQKEIAEINRKARVEREIVALQEAAKIAGADIAMNSFMMNVGLMNMGPSIYGNLKDYGSQKALTASLRPAGTMSRSNTKVSGANDILSGSKNGKNYTLDRSKSTGNTPYKKGSGASGLIGTDFENFLTKKVGGEGSFSVQGRDFDGGLGSRWWEAKSGRYWERNCQVGKGFEKFKSDMGARLKIAKDNGATYELFSNTPIPQHVKDWLTMKEIKFTEYLD